jgi:DNA-binding CsgD family transcriptional regulator/tetratricopeptide (TPR) repeat protein
VAGTVAFVGRERELARLQSALAGQVRLVLVVGDAGIGKTRLVGEGLRRATAAGMVAVGGGCLPLREKLPLLPVADALAELSRLDGGAPFEAALAAAPAYVRPEVARILPRLGVPDATGPVEGWRHERLFSGIAELLGGVARRSAVALLIEDVHWADTATLDFLTYLVRVGRDSAMSVVVTCRSDEVPLNAAVADWLTHVRRDARVEEIRLGPLSHEEVTDQVTALVGARPPAGLVEEVYARAEGHPFFTEQLIGVIDSDGLLPESVGLPARLAELLVARSARCSADARAVLIALAVAGRPLTEDMVGEITELDPGRVRAAVRELMEARLLAAPADGGYQPRHALLAEAVAAELLPGERVSLHERVARALVAAGGESLAAEAAGHWAAAGRAGEELQARLTAARAAEQVFAYADAAAHWQRAIELCEANRGANLGDGLDLPHLYVQAVDALDAAGDLGRAAMVAEQAYRQFADHPDRATAAVIHLRVGHLRAHESPPAGGPLMNEALRLFEGTPPSTEHAQAWLDYAVRVLFHGGGRHREEVLAALNRAFKTAVAAGAASQISQSLSLLAYQSFLHGEVEEGFRLLAQARTQSDDGWAKLSLAILESDALLKVGKLEEATQVGLRGFEDAQGFGFGNSGGAAFSLANAVEGLFHRGQTAQAATLIESRTAGTVDRDTWALYESRALLDLVRGEVDAAARGLAEIDVGASVEFAREHEQNIAEVALWAGRPEEALRAVRRAIERQAETDWVLILCGWLLALGMRACADLSERSRARRDDEAVRAALAAADDLAAWVRQEGGVPFTEHPWVASIPAARATWNAEYNRATGAANPGEWNVAAAEWEALSYRHRAGYARWRQAEALLAAPHSRATAAPVLSTAAGMAVEHVPLTSAIQDLARRARIDLTALAEPEPVPQNKPATARPFGLTERELDVLRLLGQGKTNPEIAAALFISPRTAGVHVTHILRKLAATTRVQAATIADRAGLLGVDRTDPGGT